MANKSFLQELAEYRIKVERNGKEIVNMPGILCLPGLLIVPKVSIAGLVAAPLLGCSIHLENEGGRETEIEKTMREAAETVIDTANSAAKTVREEMEKAWQEISAEEEMDTAEPDTAEPDAEEPAAEETDGEAGQEDDSDPEA